MTEVFKGKIIKYIKPYFTTQGIDLDYEIRLKKTTHNDEDYIYVLKYIIDYIVGQAPTIVDGQSIAFNSWILKFRLSKENHIYDLYELNQHGTEFVEGVDFSINLMRSQMVVCEKYDSKFKFPFLNQKVVISDGVMDDYPVEAVRYESPEHMTGWWITTDLYNDDVNSLKHVDLSELILKRPDLIKYLALQDGFRFFKSETDYDIWFDDQVLN